MISVRCCLHLLAVACAVGQVFHTTPDRVIHWWGRVLGSDLIVDVESEKVLYHEFLNDGTLAFQLWQGGEAKR